MSDPALLEDLQRPAAYDHPVGGLRLLETHMSWVLLTGPFAYKIKKPVRFSFADFSTLERRHHFCEQELLLNRAFAPALYRAVLPIVSGQDGRLRVGARGDQHRAVDWAVQMHQFDPQQQADVLLAQGQLSVTAMADFGEALAEIYEAATPRRHHYEPVGPVLDNFATLQSLACTAPYQSLLVQLETAARIDSSRLLEQLTKRQRAGRVRAGHGDLHLTNLVLNDGALTAFDCLEFDPELREIDQCCDIAFLIMDCLFRKRQDLAYAFLDGYLNHSGDYAGTPLLPYFARYRSLVRAKVAALRLTQAPEDTDAKDRLERHLYWADQHQHRLPGRLLIMNGVSGTGKSFWAKQLAWSLGAVRLRSDVLRKTEFAQLEDQAGAIGEGLYRASVSSAVYERLAALAEQLLAAGENVIIDATALHRAERARLLAAASRCSSDAVILRLTAPDEVLLRRIEQRARQGTDASDADSYVLRWQQANEDLPLASEPVLTLSTEDLTLSELLTRLSNH